jgi:hypothetical protein
MSGWLALTLGKQERARRREAALEEELKVLRAEIATREDDIEEYKRQHPDQQPEESAGSGKKDLKKPALELIGLAGASGIRQSDLRAQLEAERKSLNNVLYRLEQDGVIVRKEGVVRLASLSGTQH